MAEQGLDMGGGISFPIYASKDQFSGFLNACVVMPHVRDPDAILHYYLDLVIARDCEYGHFIQQLTVTDQALFPRYNINTAYD